MLYSVSSSCKSPACLLLLLRGAVLYSYNCADVLMWEEKEGGQSAESESDR